MKTKTPLALTLLLSCLLAANTAVAEQEFNIAYHCTGGSAVSNTLNEPSRVSRRARKCTTSVGVQIDGLFFHSFLLSCTIAPGRGWCGENTTISIPDGQIGAIESYDTPNLSRREMRHGCVYKFGVPNSDVISVSPDPSAENIDQKRHFVTANHELLCRF